MAKAKQAPVEQNAVSLKPITARNEVQKAHMKNMKEKPVSIFVAPAGCGKSYLTVSQALLMLDRGEINKIVITRPNVLMGRSLGALKGELQDKFSPLVAELLTVMEDTMGRDWLEKAIEDGRVVMAPLEYIRGRSLKDFTIVDECFEGSTEVLTDKGFVRFDELTPEMLVGQVVGEKVEFVKPLRLVNKEYQGQMATVSTGRFSLTATAGHDFVYYNGKGEVIKAKAAQKPLTNWKAKVSVDMSDADESLTDVQKAEIIYTCALQADAHYQKQTTPMADGSIKYKWLIQMSREDKIERFDWCLDVLGISFNKYEPDSRNRVRYYLGENHPNWLSQSKEKDFNLEEILKLSYGQIKFFIEETFRWDGSVKGNTPIYCSTNYHNIKCLQTLGHLFGYRCRIMAANDTREIFKKPPKTNYRLTFVPTEKVGMVKAVHSMQDYSGRVYCATVPSGVIMVRQRGNIAVTGNCQLTNPDEMYTICTRLADDGKMVFLGDPTQKDQKGFDGISWLLDFVKRHGGEDLVGYVEGTSEYIERGAFCKWAVQSREQDIEQGYEYKGA